MYFESFVRSWWLKLDQMASLRADKLGVNTDLHTDTETDAG